MNKPKPKPSSLTQQIKAAKKEWAKMSPEKRASIKLEGSSNSRDWTAEVNSGLTNPVDLRQSR